MGVSPLAVAGAIQPTFIITREPVLRNYGCPMQCEGKKQYSSLSNYGMQCPVCGMKLFEVKSDGEMEHTDHNPKHGGDFFMASDGWHHVEIALMPGRELRVYIYDNYTKP